uniref:Guanylate kinase-like domain-containing protein n=1 Tax=Hydatigena taeniaeformis TaxID=6205 RepID=A0A0R3X415_HYDTA
LISLENCQSSLDLHFCATVGFAGVSFSIFTMAGLRPVVLSGPSGAGKSTLLKMLMENFPQSFAFSVSHTSRKPRPGEIHGREYNFVSEEEMLKDIADGKFLEYSQFAGNYYGTPREAVTSPCTRSSFDHTLPRYFARPTQQWLRFLISGVRPNFCSLFSSWNTPYHVLESGRICILDVDANGVRSIYAAQPPLNARFIFIGPPSIEVLESRLRDRGTETEEKIISRLRQAKVDMEFANSSQGKLIYDAHIVNDDVEEAYEKLFEFLKDDIALTLDDERQQVAAS